jgi:hypothetical protein
MNVMKTKTRIISMTSEQVEAIRARLRMAPV